MKHPRPPQAATAQAWRNAAAPGGAIGRGSILPIQLRPSAFAPCTAAPTSASTCPNLGQGRADNAAAREVSARAGEDSRNPTLKRRCARPQAGLQRQFAPPRQWRRPWMPRVAAASAGTGLHRGAVLDQRAAGERLFESIEPPRQRLARRRVRAPGVAEQREARAAFDPPGHQLACAQPGPRHRFGQKAHPEAEEMGLQLGLQGANGECLLAHQ